MWSVRESRPVFQGKRDVVGDGQRVEKRARLKNHRDASAVSTISLVVISDVFAGNDYSPGVGFRNPMMCLSDTDLPTPLRPMITDVSPRSREAHIEHDVVVERLVSRRNSMKFGRGSACLACLYAR